MLDPGTNHVHFPNQISDSYGATNYKVRTQKTAQNYANCHHSWNSTADFGAERRLIQDNGNDDSGVCSPPLWRTSPPRSPQLRLNNNYRSLSPSARAQAIARGQKELMEMVSRMPEGCYELSLRDIVEPNVVDQQQVTKGQEESFSKERNSDINNEEKKRNEKKVQMNRSGSIDTNGGLLLKMVFPISWNSRNNKKKKKNDSNSKKIKKNDTSAMNNSGRVSPKPLLFDGPSSVAAKGGENEWWKNRFVEKEESSESAGLEGSESAGFSSNSGSSKSSGSSSSRSSSRNSSGRQVGGGCWSFIFKKRRQTAEQKDL